MGDDPRRSHLLAPDVTALVLPADQVARLAQCDQPGRFGREVAGAIDEARACAAPRACWRPLASAEAAELVSGPTPVARLVRRGPCWAFLATVGPALEARVREHLDAGRFLEGVLLDAAGSVAAEAVCDRVQTTVEDGAAGSARFSPGYCGWALEAQRGLFSLLDAVAVGVRLRPSLLMEPLKSVSGVVVAGAPDDLRPELAECRACDARGCTRRRKT